MASWQAYLRSDTSGYGRPKIRSRQVELLQFSVLSLKVGMPRGGKTPTNSRGRGQTQLGIRNYILRSSRSSVGADSSGEEQFSGQLSKSNMASTSSTCSDKIEQAAGGGRPAMPDTGISGDKSVVQEINVNVKDLRELITNMEHKLEAKLDQINDKLESRVANVEKELGAIQTSLDFAHEKNTEIESKLLPETEERLLAKIGALEDRIRMQEFRSRKYNLLFYGIPEQTPENTELLVRKFIEKKLRISAEKANSIDFANVHRLPVWQQADPSTIDESGKDRDKEPKDGTKKPTPPTIIARFVRYADRELCLRAATFNNLKNTGCAVRTDLPVELKKRRSDLAKLAYNLRQNLDVHTIIREKPTGVWLETRKNFKDKWEVYNADY